MKCTYSSNTSAKSTTHFSKYSDESIVIEIMMWLLHAAMCSVCSVLSMNGKEENTDRLLIQAIGL